MSTKDFIDQIIKGENAEAQETLNDVLSNLAFDAIEQRKKEIASTLFGGIEIDADAQQTEVETENQ
jgi:hypothetical protein